MASDEERSRAVVAGEAATEAVAVGLAGIANPALGLLVGGAVAVRHSLQFVRWTSEVDRKLSATSRLLDAANPLTQALFNRLTMSAMQAARTEKLELLAYALINGSSSEGVDDFVVEHFAEIATRCSPEHVRILQVISDPVSNGLILRELGRAQLLNALNASSSDPDFAMIVDIAWDDLTEMQLVWSDMSPSFHAEPGGRWQESGQVTPHSITAKGSRFLRYVTEFGSL